MTSQEIAEEAIADGLNLTYDGALTYVTDPSYIERALRRLQKSVNILWNEKNWDYRRALESVSVTRAALFPFAGVPENFDTAGQWMNLQRSTTGIPLRRRDPQTVTFELNRAGGRRRGPGRIYCIGQDQNDGSPLLTIAPICTFDEEYLISAYMTKPPTVGLDGSDDEIYRIPEKLHRSVLLPLVSMEFMKNIGDARAQMEAQIIEKVVAQEWDDQMPQNYARKPRRYGVRSGRPRG